MLRPEETIERVYLYRKPIDMRKQRTGLAALVQEVIKVDPFCGSLFVFTGRRNDRIKILWWSRNGFVKPSTQDPWCGIRTETTLLSMASVVRP
jgi:hypothetical protein